MSDEHDVEDASSARMKIYTKTGDKGTSSLYSGERMAKNSVYFEALGAVDELNSLLGVAREYCVMDGNVLPPHIEEIQCRLFDIGSCIATPLSSSSAFKTNRVAYSEHNITTLEKQIDQFTAELPPLTQFIIPSGGLASTHLQVARTVCRRAERLVTGLYMDQQVPETVLVYLNRLSDWLFTAARIAAYHSKQPELQYRPCRNEQPYLTGEEPTAEEEE